MLGIVGRVPSRGVLEVFQQAVGLGLLLVAFSVLGQNPEDAAVDASNNPNNQLSIAIGRRDVAAAKAALDKGADPNLKLGSSTLLMSTIQQSQRGNSKEFQEIVQALLDKGADVKATNKRGYTALMLAAFAGNSESVEVLLAAGSDVDARPDRRKVTALIQGAMSGNPKVIRVLLAAGADADAMDERGQTALSYAEGMQKSYPDDAKWAETVELLKNPPPVPQRRPGALPRNQTVKPSRPPGRRKNSSFNTKKVLFQPPPANLL